MDLRTAIAALHPATLTGALLIAAVLLLLGLIGTVSIRTMARRALARCDVDRAAVQIPRPVGQLVLWVIVIVAYAHIIPALRALGTALLAGASVASIVLGVAAQSTLRNAIAGLALLVYRPFRVGDRLQVAGPASVETGTVEAMTLGYTVLQTRRTTPW